MATYTSNTGDLMSGTFDITLSDASFSGTDSTFVLISVGELNIKYDTQPSQGDTTGNQILVAEWSLTCYNELGNGDLLSDKMDEIPFTGYASVEVDYSDRGGTSRPFRYIVGRGDYEVSDERRKITLNIQSLPANYYSEKQLNRPSIDDVITTYDYVTSDLGGSSATDAYNFILRCLEDIDRQLPETSSATANNTIINSLTRNSDGTKDVIRDVGLPDVGDDDYYVVSDSTEGSAYYTFARIASLHGAVWGHAFGTSYFVSKVSDSNKVTLSTSNYLESGLKLVQNNPQYDDITYTLNSVSISGTQTVQSFSLNELINGGDPEFKTLTIQYTPDNMYMGEYNGNQPGGNIEIDNVDSSVVRQDIVYAGMDSAIASKNVGLSEMNVISSGVGRYIIEIEIIGVNTLYPWQCFDFDSSVESVYQNKTFRPAELKYNFEADTVWCRAYAIRS